MRDKRPEQMVHQRIWQNDEKNSNFLRKEESQPKRERIGELERITRKEYQRLLNNFEMEGLMAQRGLWNLVAKEKLMRERGELPDEEGDAG